MSAPADLADLLRRAATEVERTDRMRAYCPDLIGQFAEVSIGWEQGSAVIGYRDAQREITALVVERFDALRAEAQARADKRRDDLLAEVRALLEVAAPAPVLEQAEAGLQASVVAPWMAAKVGDTVRLTDEGPHAPRGPYLVVGINEGGPHERLVVHFKGNRWNVFNPRVMEIVRGE